MADYRGKANKLEKKIIFWCYRKQRVTWTICHPFPPAQVFFIKEMTSLMNHVRFGTVIAYICGNV